MLSQQNSLGAYLNVLRLSNELEDPLYDPKLQKHPPPQEQFIEIPQNIVNYEDIYHPSVNWESVRTKIESESRPQYSLIMEAVHVNSVLLGENQTFSGAVFLITGKIDQTYYPSNDESDVSEWLLDWRLYCHHSQTNSYMEIDAQYYELSLLPDIPEPLKEFKYFLILHPGVESILPPESMANFYLDVTIRGPSGEIFMNASVLFPVMREWLTTCWNAPSSQSQYQPQYPSPMQTSSPILPSQQLQTPQLQMSSPQLHMSSPQQTPQPQLALQSPSNNFQPQYSHPTQPSVEIKPEPNFDDIASQEANKPRKRKRSRKQEGRENSTRAPPSKKKRDLAEDVQKEMDKLFEHAKNHKQRKQVYAHLPAEPSPEVLTENDQMKYQCPLCKKVYGRKDSCRKHISSEVWEYPCSYCGIISATAQACMYHTMAKHLHMQVFDCPHCDKRFATHYALSNHQERSHPQSTPQSVPHVTDTQ